MSGLPFAAALLIPPTAIAAEPHDNAAEIVVTATPLEKTRSDLDACLARACPPNEDMEATLAHAENQFVAGQYKEARRTLERSIGRNRKFQSTYPVGVSDLFRAKASVAEHLGEPQIYKLAIIEARDILENNLQGDDPRTFIAELEVGDSRLKLGYPDEAKQKYRELEVRARAAALPQSAARARMRLLSLLVAEAAADPKQKWREKSARNELSRFIEQPIPGAEEYSQVAELLLARLDRALGQNDSTEASIAKIVAQTRASRPILIYAPSILYYEGKSDADEAASSNLSRFSVDRWIDVGFWVNEYGRAEDMEILRDNGKTDWAGIVMRSIGGRVYVPAATPAGAPHRFFMIERYTLTAPWFFDTGSRIRKRSPIRRIERLDLTP